MNLDDSDVPLPSPQRPGGSRRTGLLRTRSYPPRVTKATGN